MKKIYLIFILLLSTFSCLGQIEGSTPAPRGIKTPYIIAQPKTTTQLNALGLGSTDRVIANNSTLDIWVQWDGDSWEELGGGDQNNIFQQYNFPASSTATGITTFINDLGITIEEDEIAIVRNVDLNIGGTNIPTIRRYIVMPGKGTYNSGNPLVWSSLALISSEVVTSAFEAEGETIALGDISSSTIEDYINALSGTDYDLEENTIYFFTSTEDGVDKSYLWIGDIPITIGDGGTTVTSDDFSLISEDGVDVNAPTVDLTPYQLKPSEGAFVDGDKTKLDSALQPANISNTAYDATSWNGVTTIAPSKDAVRDKFVSVDAAIAANTASLSGYVTTTTDQTISGTKTFNTGDSDYNIITSNSGSLAAIQATNTGLGSAITTSNSGAGASIYSNNTGTGRGFSSNNTSSGSGIYSINQATATGSAFLAYGQTGSSGLLYQGSNSGTTTYSVTKEGVVTALEFIGDGSGLTGVASSSALALASTITTSRDALLTDADGVNIVNTPTTDKITITIDPQTDVAWEDGTVLVYQIDKADAEGGSYIEIAYGAGVTGEAGRTYSYSRTIKVWRVAEDEWVLIEPPVIDRESFIISTSDLTTDITTGDMKGIVYVDFDFFIESTVVYLKTAGTTTGVTVDITNNGTSIYDTLMTTDATENTNKTATTPYVFDSVGQDVDAGEVLEVNFDAVPTSAVVSQVIINGFRK